MPTGLTDYAFDVAAAQRHLITVEPRFGDLMGAVGTFNLELETTPTVLVSLARAIVFQQLSGKAAGTIWRRFAALFPRGLSADALLSQSIETMRAVGVSQNKATALLDLAEKVQAGRLPTLEEAAAMSDDDLVTSLTVVRGIGRWTAEMFLIFRLCRPDVFPCHDLGIRKGVAKLFGRSALPLPQDLALLSEPWRPYRTVASWYLWQSLMLA